jgi:acetolactate synthase-1/2/3 large subunit
MAALGVSVRQAGFQETDIVSMVSKITKFACRVDDIEQLFPALSDAIISATSGRMGPVLVDIAMNVQKEIISLDERDRLFSEIAEKLKKPNISNSLNLKGFLNKSNRPLVVIGGGASLSGACSKIEDWCKREGIPYISTWAALSDIEGHRDLYLGCLGVYGSRYANWAIQAADTIIFLGSRLDNRQRTANPKGFAPFARKIVVDIDDQELAKFRLDSSYEVIQFDLSEIEFKEELLTVEGNWGKWRELLLQVKGLISNGFKAATPSGGLNPYEAVQAIREKIPANAIVVSDCGANLCWVYQAWTPGTQTLFTAGGNSPMGYSLPAAIGAQLSNRELPVVCFIGDGGFQMNIQELQTVAYYQLPIQIVIQNNQGYGIIKQFQDSYFDGRHFATGEGYSVPSFEEISRSYGISYRKCTSISEIGELQMNFAQPQVIDLVLPQDSLITPKVEMNRFIHDQFPYENSRVVELFPIPYPSRVSEL